MTNLDNTQNHKNTETLTEYAISFLNAQYENETLNFTDSFGKIQLHRIKNIWYTQEKQAITSRTRLHKILTRPIGINNQGITKGSILTPLGATDFNIIYTPKEDNEPSTPFSNFSMRLQIHLSIRRPIQFGNVIYKRIYYGNYIGSRFAVRENGDTSSLSKAMETFLHNIEIESILALYTYSARNQAIRESTDQQIKEIQREIKKLQSKEKLLKEKIETLDRNKWIN